MLDNLTNRLSQVMKTLRGEARLTEANIADALREVRLALLEADVALPVVKDFIAHIKDKAQGEEVQILIDVDQAADGRLTGTAALVGEAETLPFSGNLELLARLEELARTFRSTQDQGDQ